MNLTKFTTLILGVALFLVGGNVSTLYAQNTKILGKITNAKSKLANVAIPTNPISEDDENFAGYIEGDGSFVIHFDISEPTICRFYHADDGVPIYIRPNDKLYLEVDARDFQATIRHSGQGSSPNNFLRDYHKKYGLTAVNRSIAKEKVRLPKTSYRQYVDQERKEKKRFLKNFSLNHPLSRAFETLIEDKIDYEWAVKLLEYPFEHSFHSSANSFEVTDSYFDFMNQLKIQNTPAINIPEYQEVVSRYIHRKFKNSIVHSGYNKDNYYVDLFRFSKKHLRDKPLFFIQAQAILDACTYGKVELVRSQFADYKSGVPYPKYVKALKEVYEKSAKLGAGRTAPDFQLKSITNKMISLKDFKGKVVYIDFWATWCGPCLQEFQFVDHLKKHFANRDVVFLYISVDQDEGVWQNFVLGRGLNNGIHVRANGLTSKLATEYNLKGVPRYMIIDKFGNIADSNAKRPSEKGVIDDIEKALNSITSQY